MGKKRVDYSELRASRELVRDLDAAFDEACERHDVPIEAIRRLVTPGAVSTWDGIAERIFSDWQGDQPRVIKSQPVTLVEPQGNDPYRSAPKNGTASNIVVVPDMAAVDLTALVEKELRLTHLDSDYRRWDYYTDIKGKPIRGRGLKFEVMIFKPQLDQDVTIASEAIRAYFRERGFMGHAGAFTEWRRTCGLSGYHASILEDDCCYRNAAGLLCVPFSNFGDDDRQLFQGWFARDRLGYWSFVGFREVSS